MNVADNFCDVTSSKSCHRLELREESERFLFFLEYVLYYFSRNLLFFWSTYHPHSSRGIGRCWRSPCRLPGRCGPSAYPSSKGEPVLAGLLDVSCFSRVYYRTHGVALVLVAVVVCTWVILMLDRLHSCRRNTSL